MIIDRCFNCMEKLENQRKCPHCGYDHEMVESNPIALKPYSVLHGKYLVGNVLGRGGFGITYIGIDLTLQLKVAIKEYFPQDAAARNNWNGNQVQWNMRAAQAGVVRQGCNEFLSEARKMAKIQSIPEIVGVRDTFEENNTAYIVMDYIPGTTLTNAIKTNGVLTYRECMSVLLPLLSGLDKVHRQGILHRDINPANLMMTPEGKMYLLDLGAAKDMEDKSSSVVSYATQGFSAPEQYSQQGTIGPWTDVYAMAASIYYCIFGKTLPSATDRMKNDTLSFDGKTKEKLTSKQIEVLKKGLSLRPELRYHNAMDFYMALQDANKKKCHLGAILGITAAAVAAVAAGVFLYLEQPWLPSVERMGCEDAVKSLSSYLTHERYEYISDMDGSLRMIPFDTETEKFYLDNNIVVFEENKEIYGDGVSNLNLSEDALYAVYHGGADRDDHAIKMDLDGKNQEILYTIDSNNYDTLYVKLSNGDEFLYYMQDFENNDDPYGVKLMRYDLQKKTTEQVISEDILWYALYEQNVYYLTYTPDHDKTILKKATLSGKKPKVLTETHFFTTGFMEDGKLYMYQNTDAEGEYNPGLVQCTLDGAVVEEGKGIFGLDLYDVSWCVGNGWLFYQEPGTNELYRVRLDGTGKSLVISGYEYRKLCFDDNYLYFVDGSFSDDEFIPSQSYLVNAENGEILSFDLTPKDRMVTENGLEYVISNGQVKLVGYVGTEPDVIIPNEIDGYPLNENINVKQFHCEPLKFEEVNFYKTMSDDELQYSKNSEQITITGYSGTYSGDTHKVAIPSKIDGLPVTVIDENVFMENTFTAVYLPEQLRELKAEAFKDCENLGRVIFPDTLKRIEKRVFAGCSFQDVDLYLPEGLEYVGTDFLRDCEPKAVHFPSTLNNMGVGFLHKCGGEYIVSPENQSFASEEGFVYTYDKKNILAAPYHLTGRYRVPTGIKEIYPYAFCATSIESVVFPTTMTTIRNGAFQNCEQLHNVSIPYTVKVIEEDAFTDTAIKYVEVSSNCQVDPNAFDDGTVITDYS